MGTIPTQRSGFGGLDREVSEALFHELGFSLFGFGLSVAGAHLNDRQEPLVVEHREAATVTLFAGPIVSRAIKN